ncbi:phage family integrase [Yersinia pestis Angola]|nr:phage family integrase [Yersinia pestis Angola]
MGRWWRYKWITFHPSLTFAGCNVKYWGYIKDKEWLIFMREISLNV